MAPIYILIVDNNKQDYDDDDNNKDGRMEEWKIKKAIGNSIEDELMLIIYPAHGRIIGKQMSGGRNTRPSLSSSSGGRV